MAEDLSKLSREDIARLEKTISEARDLTARQEEIIKKVLAGEEKIGKLRISYLDEYLDAYSKGLDEVIARKTSKLNDAFLIMEKRATESFSTNLPRSGETKRKSSKKPKAASSSSADDDDTTPKKTNKKAEATEDASQKSSNKKPVLGVSNEQLVSDTDRDKLEDDADLAQFMEMSVEELVEFFQKTTEERKKAIENAEKDALKTGKKALVTKEELRDRQAKLEEKALEGQAKLKKSIFENMLDLEIAMLEKSEVVQQRAAELKLTQLQETTAAELDLQKQLNDYNVTLAYSGAPNIDNQDHEYNEAGDVRARLINTKEAEKSLQELDAQRLKWVEKQELIAKRKNNGILKKEDAAKIQQEAALRFKAEKENIDKLTKERFEKEQKALAEARAKENQNSLNSVFSTSLGKESSLADRISTLNNMGRDEETGERDFKDGLKVAVAALSTIAQQLETKIDEIASYKSVIDTRLQGSSNDQSGGSYWNQLVRDMTNIGAINPFYKQETFANNMKDLVNRGIAFDLKQRAFLMTIQEKIANTFDVADGTLLRLVRIQQEDSTAGRLGMESALNTFLNSMYETSEYLTQVADGVRTNLEEMQALMQGAEATEVEYQVQKWLGSLYSVGMSQNAVNSISTSLGQIAAGQIEGLVNGGTSNLLVMAANEAGLSIADILTEGLDAEKTNELLQASVNYLAELAESSKDNQVVQQQLADVFGVKASDLKAATNMVTRNYVSSTYSSSLTYNDMLTQLSTMAGSMGNRTSMAELMTNFWENGMYSLAGSMASNPVSYFIYKMASGLDSLAGGIDLPFINVLGSGVDLNTTVSDLMRVAAVGTGILGSIEPLVRSLGSSFSGQAMLNKLGIGSGSGLTVVPRGSGPSGGLSGGGAQTTSESGYASYAGNASGSDIKDSTIQESKDTKKQQMIEAKEEAEADEIDILNTTILKIYELLDDVAHGNSFFRVRVDDYGLTKASNGGNALGGVTGLGGNGAAASGSGSGSLGSSVSSNTSLGDFGSGSFSDGSTGGETSNGINGGVNLSGWHSSLS